MRPVILSATVSLDGMTAAPGAGFEAIDWFRADDEWLDYSVEILDRADVLLFGWTTFAGMAEYWPTADGPVAERMNRLEKVGFSRSARETTWQHARVSADPVAEVARLKADEGDGSLLILGSANLASTLTGHGLIDEYRLAMTPVALGAGTPLIPAGSPRVEFDLADTRVFASGVVELRCTPRPQSGPDRPVRQ